MSSFVDNWAVQTDTPASLLSAVLTIVSTTEHIAMVVSKDKMRFYATEAASRKDLRQSVLDGKPLEVVHDFKDLGVLFCSTRRASSKNFAGRFQSNQCRF